MSTDTDDESAETWCIKQQGLDGDAEGQSTLTGGISKGETDG